MNQLAVLNYIADISVNKHPETVGRNSPPKNIKLSIDDLSGVETKSGIRKMLEKDGAKAVSDWVLNQDKLLITDTTMRDGHQSLIATRMRSIDMINICKKKDCYK